MKSMNWKMKFPQHFIVYIEKRNEGVMVFLIGSLHLSRWQKRDMALTTNSRTAFFSRRTYQHNVAKHHINTFSRHLRLWMLLSGIRKIKRLEMMMSYILDWRQMSSVKSKGPK